MKTKKTPEDIYRKYLNRREFLIGAGLAALALATPGAALANSVQWETTRDRRPFNPRCRHNSAAECEASLREELKSIKGMRLTEETQQHIKKLLTKWLTEHFDSRLMEILK